LPSGHALIFFNKGGVAVKLGLLVGACVVDEEYQGEVHLNLFNPTKLITRLTPGMKITQGIVLKVNYVQPKEVPAPELYEDETDRGEGRLGSTGVE
jgi:dUTP pyrophosphatase